jgi:hypothetical protein
MVSRLDFGSEHMVLNRKPEMQNEKILQQMQENKM